MLGFREADERDCLYGSARFHGTGAIEMSQTELDEPTLRYRVLLGSQHQATGRTRHRQGEHVLPAPSSLAIAQYEGDSGFYLFYCDSDGHEITDTYHSTVAKAMAQAQWEFNVTPADWEVI
jgi:hypothetical protein